MNLIEELVEKYSGKYSEEVKKSSIYPSGKYSFHPQEGVIEIDGTKISVNIQAIGDAARVAERYRIILHLKQNWKKQLEIYPRSFLGRMAHSLFNKYSAELLREFLIKGDDSIVNKLVNDKSLLNLIRGEKVFIVLKKAIPNKIILRPAHGINDLDQFEKFLFILKLIETKIEGTTHNNGY